MRCGDDSSVQQGAGDGGFVFPAIDYCVGYKSAIDSVDKSRSVDNRTACAIDDDGVSPSCCEKFGVADMMGGVVASAGERGVKCDNVGFSCDSGDVDKYVGLFVLGAWRVAQKYLHAELSTPVFDDASHVTYADDADCQIGQGAIVVAN